MTQGVRNRKVGGPAGPGLLLAEREINEQRRAINNRAPVNAKGDLRVSGGHRYIIGPYMTENIAANATTVLTQSLGGTLPTAWPAMHGGSLTGMAAAVSVTPAGEALVIELAINGTKSFERTLATGDLKDTWEFPRDTVTFKREDDITVQVTTTASWSATTSDLAVWLEMEM
jgi:hypothetical protein